MGFFSLGARIARRDVLARRLSMAVVAGTILAGCAVQPGTIFKKDDLENDLVISTGARQRVIIANEPNFVSRPGAVTPRRLVCAEPSPDVALAVANSFGVGLSVLGQGSGSLSQQASEGVAQLAERTVSILFFREQMFRACEAYANGAITGTSYSLLLAEINKTMATIMIAETAGGNFGRSGAKIGTKASADAEASMLGLQDALGDVEDSAAKLAAAQDKVNAAQTALETANASGVQTEIDKAKADLATANGERDAIANLLRGEIRAASEASGEVSQIGGIGGLTVTPDKDVAVALGDMQGRLLESDTSQLYINACLVELGLGQEDRLASLEALEGSVLSDFQRSSLETLKSSGQLGRLGALNLIRMIFTVDNVSRYSGLHDHCRKHLKDFLFATHDARSKEAVAELEIERLRAEAERVKAVQGFGESAAKLGAICEKQPAGSLKTNCFAALTKIDRLAGDGDGDANRIPAPAEAGPNAAIALLNEYRANLKVSLDRLDSFKLASVAVVKAAPTPSGDTELTEARKTALKKLQDDKKELDEKRGGVEDKIKEEAKDQKKILDTFSDAEIGKLTGALYVASREREGKSGEALVRADLAFQNALNNVRIAISKLSDAISKGNRVETSLADLQTRIKAHNDAVKAF